MTKTENGAVLAPVGAVLAERQLDVVVAEPVTALAQEDEGGVFSHSQLAGDGEQPVVLVSDRRQPQIVCVFCPHVLTLSDGNRLSDPLFEGAHPEAATRARLVLRQLASSPRLATVVQPTDEQQDRGEGDQGAEDAECPERHAQQEEECEDGEGAHDHHPGGLEPEPVPEARIIHRRTLAQRSPPIRADKPTFAPSGVSADHPDRTSA
jgi:hypothetical protein